MEKWWVEQLNRAENEWYSVEIKTQRVFKVSISKSSEYFEK